MSHSNTLFQQFKLTHTNLAPRITQFVSQLTKCDDHPVRGPSPMAQWDRHLVNSLMSHAVGEGWKGNSVDDEFIARWIFEEMGSFDYTSSHTVRLLIRIRHQSVHANVDLLRSRFSPYVDEYFTSDINRTVGIKENDLAVRSDLTTHFAIAIDPDNADEVDDALSARRLPDGRIQVFIHIADPTSLVPLNSCVDLEARKRGQTVYLPDCTSFMFPKELAIDRMSFRNGQRCNAITISVALNDDGSFHLSTCNVVMSTVKVHTITYGEADQILRNAGYHRALLDMSILSEAAKVRGAWRQKHIDHTGTIHYFEPHVPRGSCYKRLQMKVFDGLGDEPYIHATIPDETYHNSQSHFIVEEMMLLCGHVIACLAKDKSITIPFRGPGYYDCDPLPRHDLGLAEGYVHCTSPIRRYMDCIVHRQMKRYICNESPLERHVVHSLMVSVDCEDDANVLISRTKRYWVIELFKRGQLVGNIFPAKVLSYRIYRNRARSFKYKAHVKVMYDTVVHYDTSIEDIPIEAHIRKGLKIGVQVSEADPRSFLLKFKYEDSIIKL